jgi:hypothetical protein
MINAVGKGKDQLKSFMVLCFSLFKPNKSHDISFCLSQRLFKFISVKLKICHNHNCLKLKILISS